jgi:predicted PolB exonuclease-like 3'-5' exonuclease
LNWPNYRRTATVRSALPSKPSAPWHRSLLTGTARTKVEPQETWSLPFTAARRRAKIDRMSTNGSVIVWDLETVPDVGGFASANDLAGKTDEEVRQAMGDKFPKHAYHSIVCIGALVAHAEDGHWAVSAVGAPHVGERTEKQLISAFVDRIAELKPQLVTFNGNSFDLPVLRYRAMINGVSAPGLSARPYFNRYTEDAVDLCDALSSFSSQARATLHELSRMMGMPGKPDGISGADVERYYREGRIREIADYCETDVVNTYRLWLRYELFRGRLDEKEHEASERDLAEFLRARANRGPHPLV